MHAEVGLQGLRGGSGGGERGERGGDGGGRGGRADAERNITVVADAGRGVAGGGGRSEIGGATAADRVEKVGHVGDDAAVAGEIFDDFALRIFGGAADEAGEGAAFAMRDEADAEAAGLVHEVDAGFGGKAALLEDDGRAGEIVDGELSVGRLGGIVVDVAAAQAKDAAGWAVGAHHAAGDVEEVDAVVAEVAVAGGPRPVPIVVETLAVERGDGRGAAPGVVVDGGGIPRGAAGDSVAFAVINGVDVLKFAETA